MGRAGSKPKPNELRAMVKRKAIESVDAWLKEGEAAAAAKPTTPKKTPKTVDLPTVAIGQASVAENEVAESPAEVAVTSEEAANWFWNLLEQAGYELV